MRILLILGAVMTVLSATAAQAQPQAGNPFMEDWARLPYGAPPFDRIRYEHYMPAFRAGIAEHDAEIARIANARARPTFANTIEAMERSGRTLGQVNAMFDNLTSSHNTPEMQAIETEATPLLSRHSSAIYLNQALWRRIDDLWTRRDSLNLNPEQQRLLWRYHLNFVRAGAALDDAGRLRLAAIDERLSALSTTFGQNLLADTAAWTLELHGERDLQGLSPSLRAAALQAGHERGQDGHALITLQRSSVEPFLTFSARRDLRQQAFNAWAMRGMNGNQYDNRAIIREILQLRLEKARLLGYPTFAQYVLADRMAQTPEAAYGLMMEVWRPAVARAAEERARLQQMIDAEHGGFQLEAWDWRYYAERVREAQYNVSDAETRPYFQLDRMVEGMFDMAHRLFGLSFVPLPDFPVYHPDVRAFEVRNERGEVIGLYMLDAFARPTKQSGAWMNSFVRQQRLGGRRLPVVVNCLNNNKAEPGEPVLLSFDDAETQFHEFGHALHGLLSNVTYPTLSGTAVPRDYVEFPSQVMEHWFATNENLSRFATHYQTGAPMPQDLIDRVRAAQTFNQGWATVEYLGSAFVDMDLHMQTSFPDDFDVVAFEDQVKARIGMPREIILRHRPTHFSHIFQNTYHAGYYGYLWAEVLDADAFDAFTETGDVFDPATARRFRDYIFSSGNLRDPMEAYVLFRGRPPTTAPLLRNRGFPASSAPAHP